MEVVVLFRHTEFQGRLLNNSYEDDARTVKAEEMHSGNAWYCSINAGHVQQPRSSDRINDVG